jgi:hypothetical protein
MTAQNRARAPRCEFEPVGIGANLLKRLNALLKRLAVLCVVSGEFQK